MKSEADGHLVEVAVALARHLLPLTRRFHLREQGRYVIVPSFRARKGDVIELRPKAREMVTIRWKRAFLRD